jgi:glycosyltransferase involved in cell wall biosynthesis
MKMMWPEMVKRGVEVVNLCNSPEASEIFTRSELPEIADKITHCKLDVVWDVNTWSFEYSKEYWTNLAGGVQRIITDRGENCLILNQWVEVGTPCNLPQYYVSNAMVKPWAAIYMSPSEFRMLPPWRQRLKSSLKDLLRGRAGPQTISKTISTSNLRGVFLYDENVLPLARRQFDQRVAVDSFPDLVNLECDGTFTIPRLEDLLAQEKRVVACVGGIAPRKGVMDLLRATGFLPPNWCVVVAGEILWDLFSDQDRIELEEYINNPPNNVVFHIGVLRDSELNSILKKSDLIYLAYQNFLHSSNIQVKAAGLAKPIIAPPRELIAERTKQYGLGFIMRQFGSEEIVRIADQYEKQGCEFHFSKKKLSKFLEIHSQAKYCKIIDFMLSQI